MKFLIINGKLQKGGNGKFVTVPDNYNNEPLKLNGNVLMIGGKVVGNNPKGESVLPKLTTPQNVIIDGTTLTFDEVENATSYAVLADGSEIGTVEEAEVYTDCITFTGESSDFTLAVGSNGAKEWDGTVQYSTDHNTWTTWNGTAISSVDKKLYLRGSGNTKFLTSKGARLSLSARAACSGNIQTLLEYSNPPTSIPSSKCYSYMFNGCTNLTQAPELPATTLATDCYRNMFRSCTNLTQAPELPAITLAGSCYENMFQNCTSLTTAPALPAITLAGSCYSYMFFGCTNLTAAPALPATTLAGSCYKYMFYGCKSLTTAPALPATTLVRYCYENMFQNCTSLTTAPALPATTLAESCYNSMFRGCTSLRISSTQSSEYHTAWRIPSSGTISSTETDWNYSMLSGTGGTFTDDPSINTTYYGAW